MLVGELLARVTADTRSYERSMSRARDALGRFAKQSEVSGDGVDRQMSKAAKSLNELGKTSDGVTGKIGSFFGRAKQSVQDLGDKSDSTYRRISENANSAGKSVEKLSRHTSNATREAHLLGRAFESISSSAERVGKVALAGFAGLATTTAGLSVSLGYIGVQYNNLEQTSRMAFKTLLGTQEAADQMMADIREFGKSSPFPRQAMIEGGRQLVAFGFEAKKVIPTLDSIQNAVAAIGGSGDDLSQVVGILSQINQSQTFGMSELQQFSMRGIDAAGILGQANNKSASQYTNDLMGKPLHGEEAIRTMNQLIDGMQKKYQGAVANLKTTWFGAVDRIKGAWRDLGSGLVEPFISKQGGGYAVTWANSFADLLRKIEKSILPSFQTLLQTIGSKLDPIIRKVLDFGNNLTSDKVLKFVDALKQIAPLAAAAGAALVAMASGSIPYIGGLLGNVNPLVAAIAGFAMTSPEMRGAMNDLAVAAASLMGAFQPLIPLIATLMQDVVASVAVPAVKKLSEWVRKLSDKVRDFMPTIASFTKRFGKLIAVIGVALAVFKKFPGVFDLIKANPLIAVLVGLGAAAVWAYKNVKWFRDGVDKIISWFKTSFIPGVKDGIRAFVDGFNGNYDPNKTGFVRFFQDLGNIVRRVWDNVLKPIGTTIADGVRGFISGVSNSKSDPNASGVVKFFEGIGRAVRAVWEKILKPLFSIVGDAIEGFIHGLSKGDTGNPEDSPVFKFFAGLAIGLQKLWDNVLKPVFDTIKDGFKAFADGFSGKPKKNLDKFKGTMQKLGEFTATAVGYLKDVFDWAERVAEKLGNIKDSASDAADVANNKLKGVDLSGSSSGSKEVPGGTYKINPSLLTAMLGVAEKLYWFKTQIVDPWSVWLAEKGPQLSQAFSNLTGAFGFVGKIVSMIATIPGSLSALPEDISDTLGNIVDGFTNLFGSLQTAIEGGNKIIQGLMDEFIGIFTFDPKTVLDGVRYTVEGLLDIFRGFATGFLEVIAILFRTVWDAIVNIWDKTFGPAFSALWDKIKGWFTDHIGGMVDKIKVLKNIDKVLVEVGKNLIKGLIGGIGSMFGPVKDILGRLTDLIPLWKGPANVDKRLLFESGRMVIGGFVNGLESRYGDVQSSLSGLTDSLDVNSQFKTMQLLGESIMSGLSDGISNGTQDAINQMSKATKAVSDNGSFTVSANVLANLGGQMSGQTVQQPQPSTGYGLLGGPVDGQTLADMIAKSIATAIDSKQPTNQQPLIGTQNFYGVEPQQTGESMVRGARQLSYVNNPIASSRVG